MKRTVRGMLTRSMAAVALVLLYGLSTIGISSFVMGAPKAEAARGGRGGGRGGGRSGGRGRGGGRGFRRSTRRARRLLVGRTCYL